MRRLLSGPAFRFLLCGGLAAATNWLARIALSRALPFAEAVVLAYLIGMVVGFGLYRFVVWTDTTQTLPRQIVRFVAVTAYSAIVVVLASLGLTALGNLVSSDTGLIEALAHGVAIALGAGLNYVGHSRFTFVGRRVQPGPVTP